MSGDPIAMAGNPRRVFAVLAASLVLAIVSRPANAAKEITLHTFTLQNGDGANPASGITTDRKGNLFGTTWYGGNNGCGGGVGCGTIFETSPVIGGGWNTGTIYSFNDQQDGGYPQSPLALDSSGALYGTLQASRDSPGGSAFALVPANGSWTFETLYQFQNGADGRVNPTSPVLLKHGALTGISYSGGNGNCQSGCGTLFRLAPPKSGGLPWKHTTLFSFPGGDGTSLPQWLADSGQTNTVYVATNPTAGDSGAVVSLSGAGGAWTETVLYSFSGGKDGSYPGNLVVGSDGTIYGTAAIGSGSGGMVFALSPPRHPGSSWTKSTLYQFKGAYRGPTSLTLSSTGTLLGTAFGEIDFFAGNVFELTAPRGRNTGWAYKQLYNFNRRGPSRNPMNAVFGKGGHLYGVLNGGDSDFGAVFELR
jgi:hypothetical protein